MTLCKQHHSALPKDAAVVTLVGSLNLLAPFAGSLKGFRFGKSKLGISYCLCFSGENYSQYTCKILYVVRHCQILGYNNLLCIKCFSVLVGGTHNVMNKTVCIVLRYFLFERKFISAVVTKHGGFCHGLKLGKIFLFFPVQSHLARS